MTAIGRTPEKRARLEEAGADPVDLDLFDPPTVGLALAGHDVVVNLATHIPHSSARMLLPGAWRENDRIRRDASRILAEAAIARGVPRFAGLYGPDESQAAGRLRLAAAPPEREGGVAGHGRIPPAFGPRGFHVRPRRR